MPLKAPLAGISTVKLSRYFKVAVVLSAIPTNSLVAIWPADLVSKLIFRLRVGPKVVAPELEASRSVSPKSSGAVSCLISSTGESLESLFKGFRPLGVGELAGFWALVLGFWFWLAK